MKGKNIISGYFTDPKKAENEIKKYNSKNNIYFVFNEIDEACYYRENHDFLQEYAKNLTADTNITRRKWILLDFDPTRAAGTSSTEEELNLAKEKMREAALFLKKNGFKLPIKASSGNGYHLLYRVDLPNDTASLNLIKTFLKSLDMLFSDESVQVDTSVFNASRITKLYGTKAVKGVDSTERPHRVSSIDYVPEPVEITDQKYIQKIADMLPKPEFQPSKYQGVGQFDIDEFISKNGLSILKTSSWNGNRKYVLETCPFNAQHGKDSAIFVTADGAIGFKCFHNGCAAHSWKDLRLLFEPHAYDYRDPEPSYQSLGMKPSQTGIDVVQKLKEIPEKEDNEVVKLLQRCRNVADIQPYDHSNAEIVRTGIETLDKNVEVEMGQLVFLSGITGGGKSTILGMIENEALEQGYSIFAYSGELRADKFQNWIDLQLAGNHVLEFKNQRTLKRYYKVEDEAAKNIHEWYRNRFFLYDNKESMKYEDILQTMEAYRLHRGCRIFFLDNFMTIDTSSLADRDLDAHKEFVNSLSRYAKTKNVLVYLVIHPAKVKEGCMRLNDIQGSGSLINSADSVFIVHRVNDAYRQYFTRNKTTANTKELFEADNVLEVAKDRENGMTGLNVSLVYVSKNKRLIDKKFQFNKVYGWETFDFSGFEEIG